MQAPPPNFFTKAVRQKRYPTRVTKGTYFYKLLDEVSSFGQNPKHCSGTRNTHKVKKYIIFDKKHIFLWVLALNDNKYLKTQKYEIVTFPLTNASRIIKISQNTCLEQLFSLLNNVFSNLWNCNFTLDRSHQS